MCDEYEEERLMAYGRLLKEQQRRVPPESEEAEEPLVPPAAPLPETSKPRARPLLR